MRNRRGCSLIEVLIVVAIILILGYRIQAAPVSFGLSGGKTFYSDQNMTVRVNNGVPWQLESPGA